MSTKTAPAPLSETGVNIIFDSLKGQLGEVKLGALWGNTPKHLIDQEWAAALAGFRKHEIQRGIDACATRPFAPTLGEFVRLCRPALDPEYAFWEARDGLLERDKDGEDGKPLMGRWTHPGVFYAAREMSADVRAGDWLKSRTRWTRLLRIEMERGWRDIPAPAMRVNYATEPRPPTSDERRRIARIIEEQRAVDLARKAAIDNLAAEMRMNDDGALP